MTLLVHLLVFLLSARRSGCLDFRSQAYKLVEQAAMNPNHILVAETPAMQNFHNFVVPNTNTYNQYGQEVVNPYEQFLTTGRTIATSTAARATPTTTAIRSSTSAPLRNVYPYALPETGAFSTVSFPLAQFYSRSGDVTSTRAPYRPNVSTPLIWTTTTQKPSSTKAAAKMSRLSVRPTKNEHSPEAAQVSVLSHRLLNDILVIPSNRRLYILAIMPIHESTNNQGFECGKVDVNAFIRLAVFLDAIQAVNAAPQMREAGLDLGAVVVDSCSSDLRTVADLYELLSGTNIHRNDLIAIVRDDGSYMPNVEQLARHLRLPVVNTFFTTTPQPFTTGTMPSIGAPIEAILALLEHTQSSCVSLLYDELHESSARLFVEMSSQTGVCVEQRIGLKSGGKAVAEGGVRKLLLTQARVVVVLLGESTWVDVMKAFRSEMVIAGRFILIGVQDPRWSTSKQFTEAWPQFDQLLITVTPEKPQQAAELLRLTNKMPKLAFPQHWLRQFWSAAFKCHIEGNDEAAGQQFSKECSSKQLLNMTSVSPDIDVSPISTAVHAIAYALRSLIDNICPGALVQSLNDCVNEPLEPMFNSILALNFQHALSNTGVSFNVSTGYRDITLQLNRVLTDASQIVFEPIAKWDTIAGFEYTAEADLVMEERDGTRAALVSTCPKSTCAFELEKRAQQGRKPAVHSALRDVRLLAFAITSVVSFFVCLMCMYQKVVSSSERFAVCTAFMFCGLALSCVAATSFAMPPNAASCAARKLFFPVALTAVFAPLFVKTICVWRLCMSSGLATVRPSTMFCVSLALVGLQAVISGEWALFTSATDLVFVSTTHGNTWRCSPGDKFETALLYSCLLSGVLVFASFVCSMLSLRSVHSRQNLLISMLAMLFAVGLYVSLPLVPYSARDSVVATSLLLFSYLTLIAAYCRRAFSRSNESSSIGSLIDKNTMQKSDKSEHWLDHVVLSPRNQFTMKGSFHQASTLPHTLNNNNNPKCRGTYVDTSTLPNPAHHQNQTLYRSTLQRSAHYGTEAYEMPPTTQELPSNLNQLYGKLEFDSDQQQPRH